MSLANFLPQFHTVLLFPTIEFVAFFLITFTLWLSTSQRYRLISLVTFNSIFYGIYSIPMLIYLLLWTALLWICGKKLRLRYLTVGGAILSLVFWKAIEAKLFNFHPIATPLGVSFFTFQGLTYIFARLKLPRHKPEEHLNEAWGFWKLFVGFFPTVFSGPILRAKFWERSFNEPVYLTRKTFSHALTLLTIGAFYKLCLSSIFHDYVSLAYSNPHEENAVNLLIGMYAYTFEIYHDFAGYSLMAIGVALLYGFAIPDNFRQPYLALSIRDFWQRWHISFSFWLRDYFYIALGGSRFGQWRHLRNTLLVMLVCGAWHGLSSNYLVWGAMHGIAVVLYHFIKGRIKIPALLAWFLTFHYVALTWIFFRSTDASMGLDYMYGLSQWSDYRSGLNIKHLLIGLLFIFCLFCQYIEKIIFSQEREYKSWVFSPWFSCLLWSSLFILVLILSPSGMPPFIYFSY